MRKDLPHRFEGEAVVSELLERAGCPYGYEDVVFEFRAALEEDPDTPPSDIIPLLFEEEEPRFRSPEESRRLYANLLGLWDRLRDAPRGPLAVLQDEAPPATFPAAPEGAAAGTAVPPDYVEWAWRTLTEGTERERTRAEDRLENRQGALADWVRQALSSLSPESEETALGLCVVAHEAFLRAFGEGALEAARWQDLEAARRQAEAGGLEERQPGLAAYHEDALEEATELEEDALPEEERLTVSRVLAAVRAALTEARRA